MHFCHTLPRHTPNTLGLLPHVLSNYYTCKANCVGHKFAISQNKLMKSVQVLERKGLYRAAAQPGVHVPHSGFYFNLNKFWPHHFSLPLEIGPQMPFGKAIHLKEYSNGTHR